VEPEVAPNVEEPIVSSAFEKDKSEAPISEKALSQKSVASVRKSTEKEPSQKSERVSVLSIKKSDNSEVN
jgi:hypothetical protein